MSRCFPYPPPGYYGKGSSHEALIDSIKLQKEREKAKAQRKKEKKREKKEKKREKKETKEKAKLNPTENGHEEHAQKGEKSLVESEGFLNKKRRAVEAEQLERSALTEEHGQPVCSLNPSNSSDSTQNSNKRRRHASPLDGSHGQGNFLRIRLPLQKHKEPEASVDKELLCSGRNDLRAQQKYEVACGAGEELCSTLRGTNIDWQGLPFRPDKDPSCSTSGKTETYALDDMQVTSASISFDNEMQRVYNDLIENPTLPALSNELLDSADQDWLFGRLHEDTGGERRFKANNDISCCGSSMLWPRAQYLPEAEMYALPYCIPF